MQIGQQAGQPIQAISPLARNRWGIWWKLLRPHTLTASFIPVAIGTVLALPSQHFRLDLFIIMLLASILIQVATNIFNEYYDYKRGLDHEHSVGIGGAIVRYGVPPSKILSVAQYTTATAILLGLYLCHESTWYLLPIGLSCAAVGYLYSGGPFPISATPFGELVSGLCMGLVIIVISFFLQTGTVTNIAIMGSISTSVLIGAILMSNNLRDLEDDKSHGRQTLAILLKRSKATYCLMGMFIFSYLWIIFLAAINILPYWSLLSFISIPKAIQASRGFQKNSTPESLAPAMVATAQTNTLFGFSLILGLLFHYW
ncbi:1,4-dihydroxy-2-naphthoate polyprenyltransferase [Pelosinus sp. IPA-1]|uniref:1,4-dihydroxy-2-naphthoate polyprenyltransferase n=1 Tax=Pelosinus sp. IPA-1 TaxID=3029569 RepID=UPI002436271D|nr:1,4-dihydroxy-2-naphthoate polyprenyltransferase [Pelosinus sp. IPA-1]GMA98355.1 1,4-dihydroxy-2-naphthoate octaprenyltransferase [Pelosinus sp. IPA-1]